MGPWDYVGLLPDAPGTIGDTWDTLIMVFLGHVGLERPPSVAPGIAFMGLRWVSWDTWDLWDSSPWASGTRGTPQSSCSWDMWDLRVLLLEHLARVELIS